MPLSIIGVGLPRTGTLSLKQALQVLGLGPCHHPSDATADENRQVFRVLDPGFINWDAAYSGFNAAVDSPSALFYEDLCAHYPKAQIILTVREEPSWLKSMKVLTKLLIENPNAQAILSRLRSGEFGEAIAQIYRNDSDDSVLAAYRRHNLEVRERIVSDRLLVFDAAEGWGPLCRFLGASEPQSNFPKVHSTAELIREHALCRLAQQT